MKVLVTGGAGYIGSHTCVELLEAGHEVIVVDDLVNSQVTALENVEKITGKRPAFYETDAAVQSGVQRFIAEQLPDAVIHFAGLKAVGESCRIPLRYYRNNLDSTLTLLEVMAEYGCTRLVFSSSATVYGPENPVPYAETMPAHLATNPYGWTKIMIEQMLRDYAAAAPGFAAVALFMAAVASAPMVLFLVGAQLGEGDLRALVRDKRAWILTALRLFVIPAAVLGLWRLCLGPLTDVGQTLVLLSAMPGGTCCALFTRQYGGDWGLATRCVMLSTLCAVVTVPLWLMVTIL